MTMEFGVRTRSPQGCDIDPCDAIEPTEELRRVIREQGIAALDGLLDEENWRENLVAIAQRYWPNAQAGT